MENATNEYTPYLNNPGIITKHLGYKSSKKENKPSEHEPENYQDRLFPLKHSSKALFSSDGHLDLPNDAPEDPEIKSKTSTPSLEFLTSELRQKIGAAKPEANITNIQSACDDLHIKLANDACIGKDGSEDCPQREIPERLEDRIQQLAFRPNLQVPNQYRKVFEDMAAEIPGYYDVIIVSALSSNHYGESQAMLKDLHVKVFPLLTNFTLVVYDLGLSVDERASYEKHCRCKVLTFPFSKFPDHFRTLKCFSWKVTVIRAMYERANAVLWTDASIRIKKPTEVPTFIERAKIRGVQQRLLARSIPNPYHTLTQMFDHFGDSPCAHMAFFQVETGYGIYHKEPLVEHAILNPWYGCAVRKECICPVEQKRVQMCPNHIGSTKVGLCMRNEQSAISIILAKLFKDKYRSVVVNVGGFQVASREQKYEYFAELESGGKNIKKLQKN